MYQKLSDLRKRLIISIYIDFLRFCFPFFYIHWLMGYRFSIEAVIGGGYARMEYDKYRCAGCGERMGHYKRNYFGPTRAGVSLIYFIR